MQQQQQQEQECSAFVVAEARRLDLRTSVERVKKDPFGRKKVSLQFHLHHCCRTVFHRSISLETVSLFTAQKLGGTVCRIVPRVFYTTARPNYSTVLMWGSKL